MKAICTLVIATLFLQFSALLAADNFSRPVVLPVPQSADYRVHEDLVYDDGGYEKALADIFVPKGDEGDKYPAVIFVHGGPIPDKTGKGIKDSGQYQSYGALSASHGFAGVVFNYPFHSLENTQAASRGIESLIDFIRENAAEFFIDKNNISLWFLSGGGAFVGPALTGAPEWLQSVVIYYGAMGPKVWNAWGMKLPNDQQQKLNPFTVLESEYSQQIPLFIAEAGEDQPALKSELQRFRDVAVENGWAVEYWNHPTGPHAFDILQDDKRSRDIIRGTFNFISRQAQQQ